MVFPGVLRGRPGPRLATIHTSQPRRSLSSPWMCTCHSVASYSRAGPARERRCFGEHRSGHQFGRPTVSHPEAASPRTGTTPACQARRSQARCTGTALNEIDAVPGRFEEPFAGRPESLPTVGGAASHLGGLALCGSGVRVFIQRTPLAELRQEGSRAFSAHSEKSVCDDTRTAY